MTAQTDSSNAQEVGIKFYMFFFRFILIHKVDLSEAITEDDDILGGEDHPNEADSSRSFSLFNASPRRTWV